MCKHREKWPCPRAAAPNPLLPLSREDLSRREVCVHVGPCVWRVLRTAAVEVNTPPAITAAWPVHVSMCIHASVLESMWCITHLGIWFPANVGWANAVWTAPLDGPRAAPCCGGPLPVWLKRNKFPTWNRWLLLLSINHVPGSIHLFFPWILIVQ